MDKKADSKGKLSKMMKEDLKSNQYILNIWVIEYVRNNQDMYYCKIFIVKNESQF